MPDELASIVEGLQQPRKSISPKYFYDETGSKLFEEITRLPEYYLTNAELGIMREHVEEMAALAGPQASLIEFGSGSGLKTRMLLANFEGLAAYVPVDISEEHLLQSQANMQADFPDVDVLPVVADFTRPFGLPDPEVEPARNIVYFPGSTIGNFETEDALELLRVMHEEAGEDGALLIGIDLQKDPAIINAAYNDAAGVTARFNLNILNHLNCKFGADFDIGAFEHRAIYDKDEGRVAIELVSARDQVVSIGGERIDIASDEAILTEYSQKYTLDGFGEMAGDAGFVVEKTWTDKKKHFGILYCTRD